MFSCLSLLRSELSLAESTKRIKVLDWIPCGIGSAGVSYILFPNWYYLFPSGSRTENTRRCLNLGSYNYLGFASHDEYCTPRVIESMGKFSASTCSSRISGGEWFILPCEFLHKLTSLCYHSFVALSEESGMTWILWTKEWEESFGWCSYLYSFLELHVLVTEWINVIIFFLFSVHGALKSVSLQECQSYVQERLRCTKN